VSWRNPTAANRDWGLDSTSRRSTKAVDVAREVTGSDDISMMGSCSGALHRRRISQRSAARREIRNMVLAVCLLDPNTAGESAFGCLMTPGNHARGQGDLAPAASSTATNWHGMFAWMRPNDLIWNYWVNNYLLGNSPPPSISCTGTPTQPDFGRSSWRLPRPLFHEPFVNAGMLTLNGKTIDMSRIKADSYVIAGMTDHITPWKGVHKTAQIMGEGTTFVLSNSGHLQSLLNPPTNRRPPS